VECAKRLLVVLLPPPAVPAELEDIFIQRNDTSLVVANPGHQYHHQLNHQKVVVERAPPFRMRLLLLLKQEQVPF
jgi:hypothetical protein